MSSDLTLYCTFEAAGRLFGVPITDIKEIAAETTCTRILHAPHAVRGYVNIRGQIILALDLRSLLELPPADVLGTQRLVIFKSTVGAAFGLIVDAIGEIASVSQADKDAGESARLGLDFQGRSGLIERVCQLPDRLLVVLNPRKFLPLIENEFPSSISS